MILALLTLLAGPTSPLATSWSGIAQAHGSLTALDAGGHWTPDQGKPNQFNPTQDTTSVAHAATAQGKSAAAGVAATPQPIMHGTGPMQAGQLALTPAAAATFVGSDGRFEVDAPVGAVTPADVAAAGGAIRLRITQIAPGAGSSAGGSGLVSFGTYLIQVVDAQGVLLTHGLRKPVQVALHYGSRESALDLTKAFVVVNGALPTKVSVAPIGMQLANPPLTGGRGVPGGISVPVYPSQVTPASIALGKSGTQKTTLDLTGQRLLMTASLSTPSSTMTWNTDSPVAVFGKPDPFNVDLSAGSLLLDPD